MSGFLPFVFFEKHFVHLERLHEGRPPPKVETTHVRQPGIKAVKSGVHQPFMARNLLHRFRKR